MANQPELRTLDLDLVVVSPLKPRQVAGTDLADLIDSIRQSGVLQPILVRPLSGKYEVVAGARRTTAAREAGLREIPALVREMTDQEVLELAVVENVQREEMTPLEEAQALENMLGSGVYADDGAIARRLGKNAAWVGRRRRLLHLQPSLAASLRAGEFPRGWYEVAAALDGKTQGEALLAARNLGGPRTATNLAAWVKARGLPLTDMPWGLDDEVYGPKCRGCDFNTATQGSFFDDTEPRCQNHGCAAGKLSAYCQQLSSESGINVLWKPNLKATPDDEAGEPMIIGTWADPRFKAGSVVKLRVIEPARADLTPRRDALAKVFRGFHKLGIEERRNCFGRLSYCVVAACTQPGKMKNFNDFAVALELTPESIAKFDETMSEAKEPEFYETDLHLRVALCHLVAKATAPELDPVNPAPPVAINELARVFGTEEVAA